MASSGGGQYRQIQMAPPRHSVPVQYRPAFQPIGPRMIIPRQQVQGGHLPNSPQLFSQHSVQSNYSAAPHHQAVPIYRQVRKH